MKKLILVAAMLVVTSFGMTATAQVSINVNIGAQPQWGPTGYDHVDYYYLPEIESYYSVQRHQYVYLDGSRWVFSKNLPARYSNYDLYRGYKVVVNQPKAYLNFNNDRVKYASYKNVHGKQVVIRDNRGNGRPEQVRNAHVKRSHGNQGHGKHKPGRH